MNNTQPADCPKSIWEYETAHGIFRTEHPTAGLIVHCPNFAATNAQMDKEKAERDNQYRIWLFSKTPQSFTDWLRAREAGKK